MLTLTDLTTAQQPEDKPAYLVYGNIHAIEACGVHCALHNAQSLLQDERELLERIVVYVVPRLAVDGAEGGAAGAGGGARRAQSTLRIRHDGR